MRSLLPAVLGLLFAAPAAAGDPEAGRAKARACIVCHGELGVATNPGAPNLAGQPQVYLSTELRHYRSGKRENPVMNVIAKPLTDREIDDLAAWFSSIEIQVVPR